jgi:hypothetical protein
VRQNENVVCLGRQYRQILLGELVNAANLSNLTDWINPRRAENANGAADLSTGGFGQAVFWPSSSFKHEAVSVRNFASRRVAER